MFIIIFLQKIEFLPDESQGAANDSIGDSSEEGVAVKEEETYSDDESERDSSDESDEGAGENKEKLRIYSI